LMADNQVNIKAAEQNHQERSTNKSSGFNAGVAIKVSNGAAAGATLDGNYGKGYGNGDETTYVASHVGDSQSKTVIQAGGDANLIGSQVKGKRVEVNAQNLNIESLQDTATYKGNQMNVSGSVTVGYGVSAGGSYNKSKVNADHASVNEQAGIYAGDEGYGIDVNHTDLKGGLITSTQKAEDEGKNRFSTGSLTHSDIENHSNYSGSSFGVSGSVSANFKTPFGENGAPQSGKQAVDDDGNLIYRNDRGELTTEAKNAQGKDNAKQLATGWDSLDGNMSAGYGTDKSSQSSVTKSGINTANIEIRDEKAQFEKTGKTVEEVLETIKTDITTETAAQHSGKLENQFNKEDVLKEINLQVQVTKDFIDNAQEIKDKVIDHYQEPKRKELRQAITDFHNAKVEDKAKYEDKINALIKDIYALEHIRTGLDLATGVVAGSPKVMSAKTLISVVDTETRRESLKNSLLAAPVEDVNDGGKLYSNVGHNSGAFDGIKLGGVRMNYGIICGENNQRCKTDSKGNLVRNEKGHIVYDYKDKNNPTLSMQLENNKKEFGKLFGLTGGFQAIGGEMFGIKYKPGSFLDKLTETYAGQHDLVGGQLFFYDKYGNGRRDLTPQQEQYIDYFSIGAVGAVTPTTVPHALPIEVMNLLFGVR
uniref:hemagglutinin repeat-containing protein n=1 Tax=Haemophilus haemolyticus TaxID=726 RepID=UPI0018646F82